MYSTSLKTIIQAVILEVFSDDTLLISVSKAEEIFKYFHLAGHPITSKDRVFTPRTPRNPYMDMNGDIIEDDFTPRVSLALRIQDALDATEGQGAAYHVYAGDVKLDPTDDVEVVRLADVEGPSYIKRGSLQKYNIDFVLQDYMTSVGGNKKALNLNGQQKRGGFVPSDLKPPYKKEFQNAVPDAKETDEVWSTKPITMIYLGKLRGNYAVELSPIATEYLESKGLLSEAAFNTKLLKKMGYKYVGKNDRIGSDAFIHAKDDDAPGYHKKLQGVVNKNLNKGGYYRSKKHDTLKDPPTTGISLPKSLKG